MVRAAGAHELRPTLSMTSPVRGIDHVAMTVPNIDDASRFLEKALGAKPIYDDLNRGDTPMKGAVVERQLDLAPGTSLVAMRMLRLANGPGIELFEVQSPHQQSPARPSDLGLQHFGVYVDDIDAAAERFVAAGGELVAAPAPTIGVEAGPGNAYCYVKAPWGTVIELISHPSPGAYEKETPLRRWTPPVG
jgi:catechol 2,3-dioxygenase-like lactoylglutathione lyase family enzyme